MSLNRITVNFADTTVLDKDRDVFILAYDGLELSLVDTEYESFKSKGSAIFYQDTGIYWIYSSKNNEG